MIDLKKLLNLEGAKALYDDLRERIAQRYVKPPGGIPAYDIANGVIPDTQDILDEVVDTIIDDTDYYSTNKVWSASKTYGLAPKDSPEFINSLSLGRKNDTTVGYYSVALGQNTTASGYRSYAEGLNTVASGSQSHAEGEQTSATGSDSHAEGYSAVASGIESHAEGNYTLASGSRSHAEGIETAANGSASHAEGIGTVANASSSHAAGQYNVADNISGWNEWVSGTYYSVGDKVKRTGENVTGWICKIANSDIEFKDSKWNLTYLMNYVEIIGNGKDNNNRSNARTLDWDGNERLMGDLYVGCNANSTGGSKVATASNPVFTDSVSMGRKENTTVGTYSVAVGDSVTASGAYSMAEGDHTTASGSGCHAEGWQTKASFENSHAEGAHTIASGYAAHAEGGDTIAANSNSHAEGYYAVSTGENSHAEGYDTLASGTNSHAEGTSTKAIGRHEHVSGRYNVLDSAPAWEAGTFYSTGDLVSREVTFTDGENIQRTKTVIYACLRDNSDSEFTDINWSETGVYAEVVGNGISDLYRRNARALDWYGNEYLMGDIYVGCNDDSSGGTKLPRIPEASSADGSYILQAIIASGVPTYSWTALSSLSGVTF